MTYNIEIIIRMTHRTQYERVEGRILHPVSRIMHPASCILHPSPSPVPELPEVAHSEEPLLPQAAGRAGPPGLPVDGQDATAMI
jgi:hypothetical protein